MEKREIETLDLNAEIMALVRDRLQLWGETHKDYYDEVVCDLKFLSTEIVREVYDYLVKHKSGALLTNTAKITGYSRATIDRILKK